MTKEIIELSSLYTHTKKRFRTITTDNVDTELDQLNICLESIKQYFNGLLNIIPKDISVYFGGRLQIKLEKTFFYDTKDSRNNMMSIVILEDKFSFQEHAVLDRKYEGLCFGYGDEITSFIQTDTLEYLIVNWKEIKKLIEQSITRELRSLLNKQIESLDNKITFLKTLEHWRA